MENLRLNQIKIGHTVRVVKVHGEGALRQRILDMGLTKNAEVKMRKMAPCGDPLEVSRMRGGGVRGKHSKSHTLS